MSQKQKSKVQDLMFLITDSSNIVRRVYNRHAKELGIHSIDRRALVYIKYCEGLTQVELAKFLDIEAQNLILILDRLSKQDLIKKEQHPEDRRAKCLFLTDKGKNLLEKLNKTLQTKVHPKIIDGLEEEEVDTLYNAITKIKSNLQNVDTTSI
ncbi:MarR family transcriptional regulator [Thiotrichales bacterium 19S9-12]|nr:MarR family transcriptional regulator [Thiotrichales bacterium 19S9-11]MCF6811790.1 MarR family transcriptional regulator [Thiotrichales bacterium 19S9-12]